MLTIFLFTIYQSKQLSTESQVHNFSYWLFVEDIGHYSSVKAEQ